MYILQEVYKKRFKLENYFLTMTYFERKGLLSYWAKVNVLPTLGHNNVVVASYLRSNKC